MNAGRVDEGELHTSSEEGFSLVAKATPGGEIKGVETEGAFSVQAKGSRASRVEESAARVGCRDQGTVKADADSLVAQDVKQARDISAKELKTGGLGVGLLLSTANQPILNAAFSFPLP